MSNTILYIEDDPFNVRLVKKMLKVMNYELLEAYDAQSGIEAARDIQPDVILMDYQLPDFTGLDATRIIKGQSETQHIPVIMLTSDITTTSPEVCKDAGCDAYVNKPISRTNLLRVIRQFIYDTPVVQK